MGTLKEQRGGYITVAGVKPFHNGDGVCFLDEQGRLQGFRINWVDGNKLYPAGEVPRIKPRTRLYRNFDQEFERILTTALRSSDTRAATGHILYICDSRQILDKSDGAVCDFTRAFQSRSLGHHQFDCKEPLVFFGDKAGRDHPVQHEDKHNHHSETS